MDNYKLTLDIETTDKYQQAKTDLCQALKSYAELFPQEKECLMNEFFGAANVNFMCDILKTFIMR